MDIVKVELIEPTLVQKGAHDFVHEKAHHYKNVVRPDVCKAESGKAKEAGRTHDANTV